MKTFIPYTKELKRRIRKRVMPYVGHLMTQRDGVPAIKQHVRDAVLAECGAYDERVFARSVASIMATRGLKMKNLGLKRDVKNLTKHEFFSSQEWIHLRYVALQRGGGRCACCGRTAAHGAVLQVDHIKPRSTYPELSLEIDNLQVLCLECNQGKSDWDETRWIA